jgi:phosphoglycolate phosphatase
MRDPPSGRNLLSIGSWRPNDGQLAVTIQSRCGRCTCLPRLAPRAASASSQGLCHLSAAVASATVGLVSDVLKPLLMIDHDGVVIDSFDVYAAAVVDACRKAGVRGVAEPQDVLDLFEGNFYERLRALGANDDAVRAVQRRSTLTVRNALPWLRPFPLMPQLLDELGELHHLVIVTASNEELVKAFLHRQRVTGVAEVAGAGAGESKVAKIRALISRFPGQPTYWFVSDTVGDMHEARAAGATPCGVSWGWHEPEDLRRAGAEDIAETPAALMAIVAPEAAGDFWG